MNKTAGLLAAMKAKVETTSDMPGDADGTGFINVVYRNERQRLGLNARHIDAALRRLHQAEAVLLNFRRPSTRDELLSILDHAIDGARGDGRCYDRGRRRWHHMRRILNGP